MEERKNNVLKVEVKEIACESRQMLACYVEINGQKHIAQVKSSITIQLLEISSQTILSLAVIHSGKTFATLSLSLVTLFGETLQGKTEKWYKLRSDESVNLRLKLAASLNVPEKPKAQKSVAKRPDSKASSFKEAKCPYLENLIQGKSTDTEALDNLWKNREIVANGQIKISLEPDNPSRLEDTEFTNEEIEGITLEKLQQMPGNRLKQLLKVLCVETKQFEVISGKLPEIKEEFNRKVAERRELEISSQEEIDGIRENWIKRSSEVTELISRRKTLQEGLRKKQDTARRLEVELDILKAHLGDLKREKMLLVTQKLHYDDSAKSKEELQKLLVDSQRTKLALQEKVRIAEAEIRHAQAKTLSEIEQIKKENSDTHIHINKLNSEYQAAHKENDELKLKLNELKIRLSDSQRLSSQVENYSASYQENLNKRHLLDTQLKSFTGEMQNESEKILQHQAALLSKKQSLSSELSALENSLELQKIQVLEQHKSIFEATALKISQEQICCIRADLSDLNEELKRLRDLYANSRASLLPDLEVGSRILLEESEKVLIQAEKLDQMIEAVDQKEGELEELKNAMGEVQKRQVIYVPVKNDPVDMALAEYLKDKEMQIKFIRQDGGNYLFGSKKIYIKYENQKLLVKVGGGFTSIDEFLSIYTPLELEKIENSPRGGSSSPRKSGSISPSKIAQKQPTSIESSPRKP